MSTTSKVSIVLHDGVAVSSIGRVLFVVYERPARLHRTRFIFDRADELAAKYPDSIHGLMVVLPTADVPDGPTRAENKARLSQLRPVLKQLVTVAVGDSFRIQLVRTVMRTLNVLQGFSSTHRVESSIVEGIQILCTGLPKGELTASDGYHQLNAMHDALGVKMEAGRP